ncbi:MAG: hypothetical protein JOY79_01335 [Acidobacteriaceae bacterium]|nr:hypothetical protein [Acidobacteriaceae bacterium]
MQDYRAKLQRLRDEAEECEIIGRLAHDSRKRETFRNLARDLRAMAVDLERAMKERRDKFSAQETNREP